MRYFYVTDASDLIDLTDFQVAEGKSHPIRLPVFGGSVHSQTRREPDSFRLEALRLLPNSGHFHVVDETATVYECLGTQVNMIGGTVVVSGIVRAQWEAPDKAEVLKLVRARIQGQ